MQLHPATYMYYATYSTFSIRHSEEDITVESEDSSKTMEATFTFDQTAGGTFLSLEELGKLLLHLASQGLWSCVICNKVNVI